MANNNGSDPPGTVYGADKQFTTKPNNNGSNPPGTIYGADNQFTTKAPMFGDDKSFVTLPAITTHSERIHVHHPALLKVATITTQGELTILDELSSLEEGRVEADAIFPLQCPATIAVTTITGKRYTYTIP